MEAPTCSRDGFQNNITAVHVPGLYYYRDVEDETSSRRSH